jgi:uncharacterized membrane protein YhaH (DUF805 family)
MVDTKAVSPTARGLFVIGAALLVVGLFLPWFSVAGTQEKLPADTYTGVGTTELLNSLANGPYTWIAFGWLLACAVIALIVAVVGRRAHNFGTSGVLVLVLYALLLYVAANLVNQQSAGANASVSLAYGFVVAIVGSALIEAGSRYPRPTAKKGPTPVEEPEKEQA